MSDFSIKNVAIIELINCFYFHDFHFYKFFLKIYYQVFI